MPSHFLSCTTSCTRHSATSALRSLRAGVLLNRKPWSRHCRARRGFGGPIRGGRSCTPWSSMLLRFYLSPFSWESSIRARRWPYCSCLSPVFLAAAQPASSRSTRIFLTRISATFAWRLRREHSAFPVRKSQLHRSHLCRSAWIRNNLDPQFTRSRTVELGEKDHLPATQREPAVFDPHSFRRADKRKFDVRI